MSVKVKLIAETAGQSMRDSGILKRLSSRLSIIIALVLIISASSIGVIFADEPVKNSAAGEPADKSESPFVVAPKLKVNGGGAAKSDESSAKSSETASADADGLSAGTAALDTSNQPRAATSSKQRQPFTLGVNKSIIEDRKSTRLN